MTLDSTLTAPLLDYTNQPLYGAIVRSWDGEMVIVRIGNIPGERGGIAFVTGESEARSFVNDLNESLWRTAFPAVPLPDALRWETDDDNGEKRLSVTTAFAPLPPPDAAGDDRAFIKQLMDDHTPAQLRHLARCFQMASYFVENKANVEQK